MDEFDLTCINPGTRLSYNFRIKCSLEGTTPPIEQEKLINYIILGKDNGSTDENDSFSIENLESISLRRQGNLHYCKFCPYTSVRKRYMKFHVQTLHKDRIRDKLTAVGAGLDQSDCLGSSYDSCCEAVGSHSLQDYLIESPFETKEKSDEGFHSESYCRDPGYFGDTVMCRNRFNLCETIGITSNMRIGSSPVENLINFARYHSSKSNRDACVSELDCAQSNNFSKANNINPAGSGRRRKNCPRSWSELVSGGKFENVLSALEFSDSVNSGLLRKLKSEGSTDDLFCVTPIKEPLSRLRSASLSHLTRPVGSPRSVSFSPNPERQRLGSLSPLLKRPVGRPRIESVSPPQKRPVGRPRLGSVSPHSKRPVGRPRLSSVSPHQIGRRRLESVSPPQKRSVRRPRLGSVSPHHKRLVGRLSLGSVSPPQKRPMGRTRSASLSHLTLQDGRPRPVSLSPRPKRPRLTSVSPRHKRPVGRPKKSSSVERPNTPVGELPANSGAVSSTSTAENSSKKKKGRSGQHTRNVPSKRRLRPRRRQRRRKEHLKKLCPCC